MTSRINPGRIVLLLAAAMLIPLVCTDAPAAEQRCTDLGGACICSEPLQDSSTRNIPNGHDFSDSPNATECLDYETSSQRVSTIPEFGMPGGNQVDRVLRIAEDSDSVNWIRGAESTPSDTRRMCVRYYATYDTDFSGVGENGKGCPTERNKMVQFGFATHNVQLQESVNPTGCHGPGTPNPDYLRIYLTNTSSGNYYLKNASGQNVTFDKCWANTGWCRVEVCVGGEIAAGRIYTEARITTLSNGDVYEASQPRTPLINMGSFGDPSPTGADLYHGQGSIGGLGDYYISHFMEAVWSTDGGQWIGAASEIEGGGGPLPLSPPILLPPEDPLP